MTLHAIEYSIHSRYNAGMIGCKTLRRLAGDALLRMGLRSTPGMRPGANPLPPVFPSGNDLLAAWTAASTVFGKKLSALKNSLSFSDPSSFWLPYDILGNVLQINRTLTGAHRNLPALVGEFPVADIGAADGDLAFFLESLGINDIHIIDTPSTNCNKLEGAHLLKKNLSSKVEIHDLDLDAFFQLPEKRFGMIFLLGILYHLKNPFYALETLARHGNHCMLSTRLFRSLPGDRRDFSEAPIAYLLNEGELNNDTTNHWIFTPAGLKRVIHKAGWDILDFATFGNSHNPQPASHERGESAFCLLRSRHFIPETKSRA